MANTKKPKTNLEMTVKENINKKEKPKDKTKPKEKIDTKKYKYPISAFIEDNINVRKRIGGGNAFKVWYILKKKQSLHDKKTMKDWENLFYKFLNEPTR
jgi:hypothetical protein